jgi:hypothetical protein
MPRWLLLLLLPLLLRQERQALKPNDVSIEALIPTQRFDNLLAREMDGDLEHRALFLREPEMPG